MENQIIVRVMTGDMAAFQRVYDEMAPAIFQRARIVLGDDERAFRVVRNTFADMYRFSWRLDDPENFEGWAYRITNHHIRVNSAAAMPQGNLQNVWNELYSELLPPAQQSFETFPVHEDKVVSYIDFGPQEDEEWQPILFPPELGEQDEPSLPGKAVNTQTIQEQAQILERFVREFHEQEENPNRDAPKEQEQPPQPEQPPAQQHPPQQEQVPEQEQPKPAPTPAPAAHEADESRIVICEMDHGVAEDADPVAMDEEEQEGYDVVIVDEQAKPAKPVAQKKKPSVWLLVFLGILTVLLIVGLYYVLQEMSSIGALMQSIGSLGTKGWLSS